MIQLVKQDADSAVVPLTESRKGGTSLRNMLSTPKLGLDKKIQIKILRAMAGQLKGSNIQFAESDTIDPMKETKKETIPTEQ